MWAGEAEEPVCITIFSAPNYKGHENPGSIFLTGSATEKDRVLCFEESESQFEKFMLPYPMTGEKPEDPYDAFTWFNDATREFLSQIFQSVLKKINSVEEEMSSPTTIGAQSFIDQTDEMNALLDRIQKQGSIENATPDVKFGAYVR